MGAFQGGFLRREEADLDRTVGVIYVKEGAVSARCMLSQLHS